MSLQFLIPTKTVRINSKKKIKEIIGGEERIDVLARILLNLFQWKNRLCEEITLIFYLSHPEEGHTIFIPLSNIEENLDSELKSIIFLLKILSSDSTNDFKIKKQTFEELVKSISNNHKFFYLSPSGIDISAINMDEIRKVSKCFVLGSQYDLTEEQEQILNQFDPEIISLGDKGYLASHVITIVCYHLFAYETK